MVLTEIANLMNAEIHTCVNKNDIIVKSACGADLMSDVMAFSKENALLLTGLINPQVVRTAEMMDIQAILFVRGKKPNAAMCELAEEKGIVLLSTDLPMFIACGILYQAGIKGRGTNCE